ncbi:hypothetical protein TL16_g06444 [Triparma laevis f. inornata]|uniref:Uncharacterized protein n=1 Tax=Triparma laevis f. inornata TaxID=1714386 RepID=A0A9W7ANF2_9STRA|nr:hypothetical protein TL16_g06444 [Triparma laevis f. inornata]
MTLFDAETGQDLLNKRVLVLYPRLAPPNKTFHAQVIGIGPTKTPTLRIKYESDGSEENVVRARIVEILEESFVNIDDEFNEGDLAAGAKKKRGRKGRVAQKRKEQQHLKSPPPSATVATSPPSKKTTYAPLAGSPLISASVSSRSLACQVDYAETREARDRKNFNDRCIEPVKVKKKKPVKPEAKKKPGCPAQKRPLPQSTPDPAPATSPKRKSKPKATSKPKPKPKTTRKPLATLFANSPNPQPQPRPKRNASALATLMLSEERIIF